LASDLTFTDAGDDFVTPKTLRPSAYPAPDLQLIRRNSYRSGNCHSLSSDLCNTDFRFTKGFAFVVQGVGESLRLLSNQQVIMIDGTGQYKIESPAARGALRPDYTAGSGFSYNGCPEPFGKPKPN
jgi:hypothetical protein